MSGHIRVILEGGETREFKDANAATIAVDGSLQLQRVEMRLEPRSGQQQMSAPMLIRILRRDLWREVETVTEGEPDTVEIGPPVLQAVN